VFHGRARRTNKLFDRHLQRVCRAIQNGKRRIGVPALEVRPRGARNSGEPRHLLLRETTRLAELRHVISEPSCNGGVHAEGLDSCQHIGKIANSEEPWIHDRVMDIRNVGALVTGASRGLGAALASELAREGARVALVARGAEELDRTVESIKRAGGEAHAICADIGDKRAAHAVAATAAAVVGPIGLLVHNASTLGHVPLRPLLDTDCEALESALEVNVVGPLRVTKLVVPSMLLRGRGLVIHITSDASVNAYPRWGAYGVSKAALDHLGRILGAELDQTGVRVVTVDPGEMDTRMHADAIPDADRSTLSSPQVAAAQILRLIRDGDALPNGARVEAAAWSPSSVADPRGERSS
jgi:short-subunit dehydrogenase